MMAAVATAGLVVTVMATTSGSAHAATATAGRTALAGSVLPASARSQPAGPVAANATVSFDLLLALKDASGAQAVLRAVSDPASKQYRHYLTDAQWEAAYAPTQAAVQAAKSWLRSEGFSVGSVPSDRLIVPATGTAAQVEKAFSTTLGNYRVNGHTVRLANTTLSIPSAIASTVSGVVGVNQSLATPDLSAQAGAQPQQEPPPPPSFANPQPCASYWGEKIDTTDNASLYKPYTSPLPYDICGYKPAQLRAGYGLRSGNTGAGVAIAIVDAYDSPTLLSDAQHYFSRNAANLPLASSQFFNVQPATVGNEAQCNASSWYQEQALDVESSHSMAPKADILFVGAQDCFGNNLLSALQTAVTSGASVVSDSWGDPVGDVLDDVATKTAFDNTFMLAGATGVSVLFATGDFGDNFADFGLAAPDYPPSSPFVTSVGGTTLEIGQHGARLAEYGWSTAKQVLCGPVTVTNCGSATNPTGSLNWQAGGGGGTSYTYTQPYYQAPVVPSALALRNQALFGPVPLRVEPDIAMDGDAQSGMLVGMTETFPGGHVGYGQFKLGGTSLASPLLAGVVADADQAAGVSLGFLNPTLYKAYAQTPGAFNDIVAPATPLSTAVLRVDYANTQNNQAGYVVSLRAIDYEGPETYCDGTGNCATRNVTLSAGKGFDSLTGLGTTSPEFVSVLSKF
jgi:subtilase family serine protease